MSAVYRVVFNGHVLSGHSAETVKQRIAAAFKLSPETAAQLFSGAEVVLKKTTDEVQARRIHETLSQLGAVTKMDFDLDPEIGESGQPNPAAVLHAKGTSRPDHHESTL